MARRICIQILSLLVTFALATQVFAAGKKSTKKAEPTQTEANTYNQNQEAHEMQEVLPPPTPHNHYGFQFQFYDDPITNYEKLNFANQVNQFGYDGITGLTGLVAMFSIITPSHVELSTGLDYSFTQNVQGTQTPPLGWVNNVSIAQQQFSMIGLRAIQVGYRVAAGPFSIIPYGALGVYYGKNVVTFNSSTFGNSDVVTYSKIYFNLIAGARLEYHFLNYFAAGLGLELYDPIKYSDQFSQNGPWVFEGDDDNIRSNMDFATNFGGRAYLHLAAYY